jgi:hypothetical protein
MAQDVRQMSLLRQHLSPLTPFLTIAILAARTLAARASAKQRETRARDLYLAQGGTLKDWQQVQTDLISRICPAIPVRCIVIARR